MVNSSALLDLLFEEIKDKSKGDPTKSYTAFLTESGIKNIAKKVIEEANEVADAALNKDDEQIILETADLFFHSLVLLSAKNIELKEIIRELNKRRKTKGLSERAIAKNKFKLDYGK